MGIATWGASVINPTSIVVVAIRAIIVVSTTIRIVSPVAITGANDPHLSSGISTGPITTIIVATGIIRAGGKKKSRAKAG